MENEIIISNYLISKLNDLETLLYRKEYFGFEESSKEYVDKIYDVIYEIPNQKPRKSKDKKLGEFYITYRPNKNTMYCILFSNKGHRYIIEDIITNHERAYDRIMGVAR
jgi:hypothetical protein